MSEVTIRLGTKIRLNINGKENDYFVTSAGTMPILTQPEILVFKSIKIPVEKGVPERFEITVPKDVIVREQKPKIKTNERNKKSARKKIS